MKHKFKQTYLKNIKIPLAWSGAFLLTSLIPLVTITSCASSPSTVNQDLLNRAGGPLLNQKNHHSGLVASAYANLFNLINPRTNLVFYPWNNKMAKYGFDLDQFLFNLKSIAPQIKIKIDPDQTTQIKDGLTTLSLLVFDPTNGGWQKVKISGFLPQIKANDVKNWNISAIRFSPLEWIKANLALKIVPSQIPFSTIWQLIINQNQVLSQHLFAHGLNIEIIPDQNLILVSQVQWIFQDNHYQIDPDLEPLWTIQLPLNFKPQYITSDQIRFIFNNEIFSKPMPTIPLSAGAFKRFLIDQPDYNYWDLFANLDPKWFNALGNYNYDNQQPKLILKPDDRIPSDDYNQQITITYDIVHPQFIARPVSKTLVCATPVLGPDLFFQIGLEQSNPIATNLMQQLLMQAPDLQLKLQQWFNQSQTGLWSPLTFNFRAKAVLNNLPSWWFDKPVDYQFYQSLMQQAPNSKLFVNSQNPQINPTIINKPKFDYFDPNLKNANLYNFANQWLQLNQLNPTIISDVRFHSVKPETNVFITIKQPQKLNKTLELTYYLSATWHLETKDQFENTQRSLLKLTVNLNSL